MNKTFLESLRASVHTIRMGFSHGLLKKTKEIYTTHTPLFSFTSLILLPHLHACVRTGECARALP